MKRIVAILALTLIPLSVFAYVSPGKPTGFVNDFAGVMSAQERQDVQAKLGALERETGFEMAVVTVKSLGGDTVENYAVRLFEEWGIGNEQKDNGLLLLVAVDDHKLKIETGYGTSVVITDLQAGNIIRTVITPAFKQGNYGAGIAGGVDALISVVTHSPDAAEFSSQPKTHSLPIDPQIIFAVFIIFSGVILRVLARTKSWWLGGVIGAGIGGLIGYFVGSTLGTIVSAIMFGFVGLMIDFVVSRHPPGSGRGGMFWGGFGGGSSGGGGGFGGFGGGSSGGGGASGSW